MSDNKKISLGLPWISVAIGGLSGYLAMGNLTGLLVGCLCGILISVISYFGLIPFGGAIIYYFLSNALFSWLNVNFPILFWYGLIWSIIFTCITTVVVIGMIGEACG